VHFADFVDLAGELEDTLGRRRLARVDVGEDADVSVFAKVFHSFARAIWSICQPPVTAKARRRNPTRKASAIYSKNRGHWEAGAGTASVAAA
jgi:hypothetical protein